MTQVAVITGGSSGIGQQLSIALSQRNYKLVVIGTHQPRINATLSQLQPGQHLGLVCDVADEIQVQSAMQTVMDAFGQIDVLVAAAGIGRMPNSTQVVPYPVAHLPLQEWNAFININLTGVFLANRAVLPVMRAQKRGHIINISSAITPKGMRGQAYAAAYSAAKFGVIGLTEALAEEVSAEGIRVQTFLPGLVATPMVAHTALSQRFGRPMQPDSVVQALIHMLEQPLDSVIVHPHLIPFNAKPAG